MTVKTIKGVIRGGKIEPSEALDAPEGTEVDINVPIQQVSPPTKMITFGMFADPNRPFSTEEDFREARRSIWGDADGK
jgi:hypothetical protein